MPGFGFVVLARTFLRLRLAFLAVLETFGVAFFPYFFRAGAGLVIRRTSG